MEKDDRPPHDNSGGNVEGENLEKDDRPPHDNSGDNVEGESEVWELSFSTLKSKSQKKKLKAAASGWNISAPEQAPVLMADAFVLEDASNSKKQKKKGKKAAALGWNISTAEQAPVLMADAFASEDASNSKKQKKKGKKAAALGWNISAAEQAPVLMADALASEDAPSTILHLTHNLGGEWPRYGARNFVTTSDVAVEPHNAVEEAIPAETSPTDEPYIIAPEEDPLPEDSLPEDSLPAEEEAFSTENPIGSEKAAPQATLEASQAKPIVEGFDSAKKHTLDQHDSFPNDVDDPYEPTPKPDIASVHSAPAEGAESLVPPPTPDLCAVRDKSDDHSPPPSAPSSSVAASVLETAVPEAPTEEDGHTITLKILNGSTVLRAMVFIKVCTRTAILHEARAYYMKWAQDDQILGTQRAKGCDLALMSLSMYGYDVDLSTYKVENLSFLLGAIEKTGIPSFTLRVSEI